MKVVSALKKMCEHCYFKKKGKKVYVRCIKDPRHKQRQGSGFCTIKTIPIKEETFDNHLEKGQDINFLIFRQKIENMINNKF